MVVKEFWANGESAASMLNTTMISNGFISLRRYGWSVTG